MEKLILYRGEVFDFMDSPLEREEAYRYFPDGALVVQGGKIVDCGPFQEMDGRYADCERVDYSGKLLMPGFIDSHIHYPQAEIIGMYGKQLLDWLHDYTFPAEQAFASPEHADKMAHFFIRELLRNGTTACMAYATVHPASVAALFSAASEYNMCMLAGKVLMDRNAPAGLTDTVESGESESRSLIERWHGKGRNRYVITPRFALSCSPEQLAAAGRLHKQYPDTYIQTHLSENKNEIANTLSLFPDCRDYLEVYERAGLVTDRSVFGHCVHLSESESRRLATAGSIVAHCPTSNLFLGSGLFDMQRANRTGLQTLLATDVGAGTSFSMLRTMGEAYKVQQLNGYPMSVFESLYKCTLGAAKALRLDDEIGSFKPGCKADFIVLDYAATPLQQTRMEYLRRNGKWTLEGKLFGLQTLGDDRNVREVYVRGKKMNFSSF